MKKELQKSKRCGKISGKKDQAGSGKKENSNIGEKLKREKLRQCFKHIYDNMSSNISNNIFKKHLGEIEEEKVKPMFLTFGSCLRQIGCNFQSRIWTKSK